MSKKMGLALIIIGVLIIIVGFIYLFHGKLPFLGNLPGDFKYEKDNFKFYFPFSSGLLISLIISAILFIINRLKI